MANRRRLAALALAAAALPPAAWAEDYLGVLKPARAGITAPAGFFSLASEPSTLYVLMARMGTGMRQLGTSIRASSGGRRVRRFRPLPPMASRGPGLASHSAARAWRGHRGHASGVAKLPSTGAGRLSRRRAQPVRRLFDLALGDGASRGRASLGRMRYDFTRRSASGPTRALLAAGVARSAGPLRPTDRF